MKLIFILLSVIFCLVNVSGRHVHDADSEERINVEEDSLKQPMEQATSQSRHRRRSRQSFYDFNYPPYFDYNRRDNSRQDEMYSQILRLLDEISTFVKRPPHPPPPQPIYIPYPVPYFVPGHISCGSQKPNKSNNSHSATTEAIPIFTDRWPEMDDELQNWGLIPGDVGANDDDSDDGARPILLKPILPDGPIPEPPPVEHGSVQAGLESTTKAAPTVKRPGVCQAAILTCCNISNKQPRQTCFENYGCSKTFSTRRSCNPEVVKAVLAEFAKVYAPKNET